MFYEVVTALAEFKFSGPVPSVDSCPVNKRGPLVLLFTHACVEYTTNMRQRERGGGEDRERWKCTSSLNPDDTQIINFLTFADLPFVHCRGIAAAWRTMFMHVRPRNTGSVNGTRIGKHSYLSLKKTSHVSIQEGKENWKCVSKSNFYTNIGLKIIKKFK